MHTPAAITIAATPLLVASPLAIGEIVEYQAEIEFYNSYNELGLLNDTNAQALFAQFAGQTGTLNIRYDTTGAIDNWPDVSTTGIYEIANMTMTFEMDGFSASGTGGLAHIFNSQGNSQVIFQSGYDRPNISYGQVVGDQVGIGSPNGLWFQLFDTAGTTDLVESEALPTGPIDLNDADPFSRNFGLRLQNPSGSFISVSYINGRVISLTQVPSPTSPMSIAAGSIFLSRRRR